MRYWMSYAIIAAIAGAMGYYATLYAAPGFLMNQALERLTTRPDARWNHFTHAPPVNARAQLVVRPSPDLLYSSCPFDLDAGPLDVTAAPIPAHYSSISVFDSRTNVVFVSNDEDMAGRPMRVVLALPEQGVPAGVAVVRLSAPHGIILQRVLLSDPGEAASIDPLRRRAVCRTL